MPSRRGAQGSARSTAITVAVATCDRPEPLTRCLEALVSGRVVPAEVIVVDQGRTKAVVRSDRVEAETRVVYIRQAMIGLSASRNEALATAACELVAFTDDDCIPDPGWLEAIERAFAGVDPPDAVTGPLLSYGDPVAGTYATGSRTSVVRRDFSGRCFPWDVGTGANFAARKDWLERVGGFDLRLGVGTASRAAEDIDIFYRLLEHGARIRYEPDAIVRHERIDRRKRMANRVGYGLGMGAMCSLTARRHDPYAARILARWLSMRLARLAQGALRGQVGTVREELLVLAGTARGLLHGFRVATRR